MARNCPIFMTQSQNNFRRTGDCGRKTRAHLLQPYRTEIVRVLPP